MTIKLRTEPDFNGTGPCEIFDKERLDDLQYDAAVAHALMQALDEEVGTFFGRKVGSLLDDIQKRAAEILREQFGIED